MSFFRNLFAAKSTKSNKARLGLETLDAREVPATLTTTNLTANIDPVDFTPVFDTSTLFGSIKQDGRGGGYRVIINESNGNAVVTLQQLSLTGAVLHTQTASFDLDLGKKFFVDLGNGNDVFMNNAPVFNSVIGGEGADIMTASDGFNTWSGNGGNDSMFATSGVNVWNGGAGNDIMNGGNLNDVIDGGDGNDSISGGDGVDILSGVAGGDFISGGAGADYINGNEGDDTIDGGRGVDIVIGGLGNDTWN
jgi:Ca2+-binding RTX toxin-like protein